MVFDACHRAKLCPEHRHVRPGNGRLPSCRDIAVLGSGSAWGTEAVKAERVLRPIVAVWETPPVRIPKAVLALVGLIDLPEAGKPSSVSIFNFLFPWEEIAYRLYSHNVVGADGRRF